MITSLTPTHTQQILDFCYQNERENIFTIGSFNSLKDPFLINKYYGYFKNDELIGLSTYFETYGSFVINAERKKIIEALIDYNINEKIKIKCIPCLKKHGEIMLERLRIKHDLIPKNTKQETVYTLTKKNFKDFSIGTEEMAKENDRDELACFHNFKTLKHGSDLNQKILDPYKEFILRNDGKIISKAYIYGISKHYFELGGVATLEEYQKQGYSKQVVSFLCKHYFNKGLTYGLLFTENTNIPAQKVYNSLGFKAEEEFLIAEF